MIEKKHRIKDGKEGRRRGEVLIRPSELPPLHKTRIPPAVRDGLSLESGEVILRLKYIPG